MGDFERVRTHMVDNQLRTNDVTDLRILDAMGELPRERFVPSAKRCIPHKVLEKRISLSGTTAMMLPGTEPLMCASSNFTAKLNSLVRGCSPAAVARPGGQSVALSKREAESVT